MVWQLSELVPHLSSTVRAVDAEVDDSGVVPRARIAPRPPNSRPFLDPPETPGHLLALVLPDPREVDFAGTDAQARQRYSDAQFEESRAVTQMRVLYAPSGNPAEVIETLMGELQSAVGVLTDTGTCVVGVKEQYRGDGCGRVITTTVPESLPAHVRWLIPSAVRAVLLHSYRFGSEQGGAFVAGVHDIAEMPSAIDAEIEGLVYRLAVLEVRDGYWPMGPLHAPDAATLAFARAWAEVFPDHRCPIGWVQILAVHHDPDPQQVPDPPFPMTVEQRLRFVELWHTAWPAPTARSRFTDRARWDQAVELAESLLVATSGAWNRELEVLPRQSRPVWCDRADLVAQVAAAAIYKAAIVSRSEVDQVAPCVAADLLGGERLELFEGLPVDSVMVSRWGKAIGPGRELAVARLRAVRMLSCPHPGASPGSAACTTLRERIEHGQHTDSWAIHTIDQITGMDETGAGTWRCAACDARESWMLVRPERSWWWLWVLCRCGHAAPLVFGPDPVIAELPWTSMSQSELARHARTGGYGPLADWGGPAADRHATAEGALQYALPYLSWGGDRHWREAVRRAATTLAGLRSHPGFPRSSGGYFTKALIRAVSLAALTVYVLAEDTGLPMDQIDLRRVLDAGPAALHATLAAALPDTEELARLRRTPSWPLRARHWPVWKSPPDPRFADIDPADVAWAALAAGPYASQRSGQTPLGAHPLFADAEAFREGFRTLADLLDARQ